MARAEAKFGWRSSAWQRAFKFTEVDRLWLVSHGLPVTLIDALEDAVADFLTFSELSDGAPTRGGVKEMLRRGGVAHKKGKEAFQAWMRSDCDERTSQLLAANAFRSSEDRVTFENFPMLADRTTGRLAATPGRRKRDEPYELAERVTALFIHFGLKVSGYDPTMGETLQIGSKGGSALGAVLHRCFSASGHATTDIDSYLAHAIRNSCSLGR